MHAAVRHPVPDGDGRFAYGGHPGSGFTRDGLRLVRHRRAGLERPTTSFANQTYTNEPAHRSIPRLGVAATLGEWTGDERLRQPVFLGMHDGEPTRDV